MTSHLAAAEAALATSTAALPTDLSHPRSEKRLPGAGAAAATVPEAASPAAPAPASPAALLGSSSDIVGVLSGTPALSALPVHQLNPFIVSAHIDNDVIIDKQAAGRLCNEEILGEAG